MSQNDVEYYIQRALQELDRAEQSAQANVAEIHLELARQYKALAEQSGLRPTLHIGWEDLPQG